MRLSKGNKYSSNDSMDKILTAFKLLINSVEHKIVLYELELGLELELGS
jgi:hypothetical protein